MGVICGWVISGESGKSGLLRHELLSTVISMIRVVAGVRAIRANSSNIRVISSCMGFCLREFRCQIRIGIFVSKL